MMEKISENILEKREGNFWYLCHTLTIIGHIGQAVNKQKEILVTAHYKSGNFDSSFKFTGNMCDKSYMNFVTSFFSNA